MLPIAHSFAPMEAVLVDELPTGAEWQYEPKWDGFRCLAFRDGDAVELMSKGGKPLARYFPDVVELVRGLRPTRFVLDGEIVVPEGDSLSFDKLLLRIHPAHSRVTKLAREHPASYVVFDLLVDARGRSLVGEPLAARRAALEELYRGVARAKSGRRGAKRTAGTIQVPTTAGGSRLLLSPATKDLATVRRWLRSIGGGLDGIVAKELDLPYKSGERAMEKVKSMRTADCVVGGFRYASKGRVVGSLLLGLYDEAGLLHHVGFTSNIARDEKPALTKKLEKLVRPPGFTGRAPGGPSRWSAARSAEWQPLAPKLVVEVQYDHFSGGRFRHGTSFLRWRPDKRPDQCMMEQVEQESRSALGIVA